ncbi:uncharacterized protein LOC124889762 [Capsicum annuum]|uniref:uncharacterized protein LOC124889762 n=1 Tax=Capsicum annuum TaxID=4072 RepID=UPI001FB16145|nr:uncharacterized protein LOC124889762 [Capsicum annuum]
MELAKFQVSQKNVIEDERSFDSDDDFQDPPPKQINENLKKKQKVNSSTKASKKLLRKNSVNIVDEHTQKRTSAPRAAKAAEMKTPSKPASHIEEEAVSKPESHAETEAFISKKVFDAFRDEFHTEVDLGTEEQIRTPPKIQEVTTDEQRDDPVWPNSQNTIPNELLPCMNAYNNKSIIVHPSANRELQTPIQKIRIRRPSKFKESPYTMKFGSAAGRSAGNIHKFPQKHPFVYHPIDGIVDTKIVKKSMDRISVDLLRVHGKRKEKVDYYKKGKLSIPMMHFRVETIEDKNWFYTMGFPDQSWTDSVVHDVYSVDDPNLMAGGQEAHLVEYIDGFRMHAAVPWHTVKDIYILVNIKEKHHWVLAFLSFSKRCIFLYNSYESSGHYPIVLAEIEKLAEIIHLCLQVCDFYDKKEIDLQNHPRYKDKDSSDMFDVLFEENLPQQPSERLDCGVYMVAYAECLSYGHKILSTDFDPDALRRTYAALLWDYGIQK